MFRKNILGLQLNFLLMQKLVSTDCMISVIVWSHTPNFSLCINLVTTKYDLKSQYVKLPQLWSLTVNCVLILILQTYHKVVKNLFSLHKGRPNDYTAEI